jgi:hypothetical protein
MTRTYRRFADPVETCRNALQQGFLTKAGRRHWSFGRRHFHTNTVNALIDSGEAVRVGDHIVKWSSPQ